MKKMSKFKRIVAGLLSMTMIGFLAIGSFSIDAKAAEDKLTGKTAMEITQMMGKGWNLGNTFDANGGSRSDVYSQETSWGNPKVTKELIDGVKAAGFDTIRIPVTWYRHITAHENYKIDDDFMARIKEVVDYAFDNDLFVILNVHHETWVNSKKIDEKYKDIGEELSAVWAQIADTFADYDQHLIFEGMNEPRAQGTSYEWTGNQACYDAVNYLNQCFVSTIRANGKGYNSERALMIPGYAASNSSQILKSITIPTIDGKDAENIIISVHCYSPYNFCLSDAQTTFDPTSAADTGDIKNMISTLNLTFINKGIPVVIGECGATNSQDNLSARKAWFLFMGEQTAEAGIPAVVWDNGAKGKSGGECHNYFVRKTGEMAFPELITAFIFGDVEARMPKDMEIDFEPYKEGGTTIMAAPEQYGFSKKMGKIAKINHTPDAGIGFSAKASSDENFAAQMDLSKFAGKRINVKLFLESKSSDSVTVGIIDGAAVNDIVTANIDGDWTEVSFSVKFSEETSEKALTFKGSDEFYIDDISIKMVEDADAVETYVGKESTAPIDSKEEVTNSTPSSTEAPADNTTSSDSTSQTGSGNGFVLPIVICVVVVIAAAIVVIVLKKKKK